MNPEEKAKEIYNKFLNIRYNVWNSFAKESALISVDEIIYALNVPPIQNDGMLWKSQNEYWNKVKQEIEKL